MGMSEILIKIDNISNNKEESKKTEKKLTKEGRKDLLEDILKIKDNKSKGLEIY